MVRIFSLMVFIYLVRQNALRAVIFSLIFSFTVYDVTKKALFGWNMLNWKKTSIKELGIV